MNIPYIYIKRLFVAALILLNTAASYCQNSTTVRAELDVAHTIQNKSILIDALSNDDEFGSSFKSISLKDVVLQNQGTASIENGKIRFTPNPDFKGTALINYTVCNEAKNCDCGLVMVDVAEAATPIYQEIYLFVLKEKQQFFILPLGFDLENPNLSNKPEQTKPGQWVYAPATWADYMTFRFVKSENDGSKKYIDVNFEVLKDKKRTQFIVDDQKSTAIGTPLSFNLLDNDKNRANITSIKLDNAQGGSVRLIESVLGLVEFTPNLPDGGTAQFDYTINTNTGVTESGKATISISNYPPSREQYKLTSTGYPLVIKYPAPISNFRFEVFNDNGITAKGGKIKFYESIDTIINLEVVKEKNVLIYTPNIVNEVHQDNFSVKYCVGNDCSNYLDITVDVIDREQQCVTQCVWAGDTNKDGIVNIFDLFPIGYNIGTYGKKRESATNQWYPQGASDWGTASISDIDLKHADTNGDGLISATDTVAIEENYGKTNVITPIKTSEEGAVEIQISSNITSARYGDLLELTILMGSSETPVYDAKGLGFSVLYDAEQIKENSIYVDFGTFNWINRFDAFLSKSKVVERGQIEAGLVRSRGNGTTGHGEVGKVRGIVTDDVTGFRKNGQEMLRIDFKDAYMMGPQGQLIKLKTKGIEIPLSKADKNDPLQQNDLVMYPNPAKDNVNFYINGVNTIQYIRLMDATGREVKRLTNVDAKSALIPVDPSMKGFFIAEVMTEKGRIIKKLEIF
jgi:hypothetical protein